MKVFKKIKKIFKRNKNKKELSKPSETVQPLNIAPRATGSFSGNFFCLKLDSN
jgi:hypothetical protein